MMALSVRRAGLLVLVAALTLSCGRRASGPPTAPPVPPPSRIEAVFPPARSMSVLYDVPIWVQFAAAVDTATISDRTVFFKTDTRRLPATLFWDPATRRLHITPLDIRRLRQTYTIELSPMIGFTDGTTLGTTYFWQFTTNSLRRVHSPRPMDGRVEQSPFVALQWSGLTESSAGPVTYEIHVGPDSVSAADPALPAVGVTAGPPFLPRSRWRQDGPSYWAIHALNGATGERLVSPAWRFDTFPADAAYDSFPATTLDWNWVDSTFPTRQHCTGDSLPMAPNILSTIRWNFGLPDTTVRLVGAAIEMSPRYPAVPAVAGPSIWYAIGPFAGCQYTYPGPPHTDEANGRLADAVVLRPDRIRFSSDAFVAHVEATRRLGGLYGYLLRSPFRRSYYGPGVGSTTARAVLWLYVYRPPSAPASLAAARSGG
jgi:Big-like domain-containing protein